MSGACSGIMPLAAPIGSGLGIQNKVNIRIIKQNKQNSTNNRCWARSKLQMQL